MSLFEPLGAASRSPAVREAVDALATESAGSRGAVYTRAEVVALMLDLAGYTPDRPLHLRRAVEPAFGEGDFLLPMVERLLAAASAAGIGPDRVMSLSESLRAVEIHQASFALVEQKVLVRLLAWGASPADARQLLSRWLCRDDFLLAPFAGEFDLVVGNPPYLRQERIPSALLAEYRRRYQTIYDRADLYVPFIERGLNLLKPDGHLAFICSNRWVKNRYGRPLRDLVARRFHLAYYVDLEGTPAFQSDVIAYPSIVVITRNKSGPTRIARQPELSDESLTRLSRAMTNGGPTSDARIEDLPHAVRQGEPWLLDERSQLPLLRRLESTLPDLESSGCKVGIGVATGADRVFIGPLDALPVEDARKLPLAMARDLARGQVLWSGQGVINPFEPDGSLARPEDYPRFAAWLAQHREVLCRRHCAKKNPSGWYRTIDRIWPELTCTPKLLIPDIKGDTAVSFDEGHFYPHHNLYHITSPSWDLRALATLLRSSVALVMVAAYSVRMSGGFLRFQAQYLRRLRVPRWGDVPSASRDALRVADPADQDAIDAAAAVVYGLSEAERAMVRAQADATRVGRRT